MIEQIFSFPKELASPGRRLVEQEKFYDIINRYNGRKNLWCSLYKPTARGANDGCCVPLKSGLHYCSSDIRFVWLDTDNGACFDVVRRLCLWADSQNLKHLIVFSGEHYHFYAAVKGFEAIPAAEMRRRQALAAAQVHIAKSAGLTIGDAHSADIDSSVVGDIRRTVRVINTVNLGSELFCIPLTHEDLQMGEQHIRQKAKSQCLDFVLYGRESLDVSMLLRTKGNPSLRVYAEEAKIAAFDPGQTTNISTDKVLSELSRACEALPRMLLSAYVNHHARYHIIMAMKELGFTIQEAGAVLDKHLRGKRHPSKSKDNFYSCVVEERQLQRLYARDDIFFSHAKMVTEGFCRDDCGGRGVYL